MDKTSLIIKGEIMKNKIGILTFYNTTNYGALLQMFALYKSVEKMGKPVEIIRYYCEAVEERENLKITKAKSIKGIIKSIILKKPNSDKQKRFREFEKQNFCFSHELYNYNTIKEIGKEYNSLIVGSDQIWNTKLTGGDYEFFLENVEDVSKNSYAASFGVEELSKDEMKKISGGLQKFNVITVREKSGEKIVKECIGKSPKFVLDPTFLFDKKQWKTVMGNNQYVEEKPYILLYLVQNRKKTISYAQKLAEQKGWNIKYINISPYSCKGVENIRSASPIEFLQLLNGAALVITGSYHGLALSINLERPVYYELNENFVNFNTRISSLISVLNMEACRLDYNNEKLPDIDYNQVNSKLNDLREESVKELERIVGIN